MHSRKQELTILVEMMKFYNKNNIILKYELKVSFEQFIKKAFDSIEGHFEHNYMKMN
jgi:hypothetical protein